MESAKWDNGYAEMHTVDWSYMSLSEPRLVAKLIQLRSS